MRAPLRHAWLVAFVLVALLVTGRARAQAKIDLQVSADAETIEIGDYVNVTVKLTTNGEAPTNVEVGKVPPSFVHHGISNRMSVTMNGRRMASFTFRLQSTKTGTYKIGPAFVEFDTRKVTGRAITVKVVPPGQAPHRPSPQAQPFGTPFSLLDPWRPQAPQFPPPDDDDRPPPGTQADAKLGMDAPRGSLAFLHAMVDKTNAVVGEPVVVSMLLYVDAAGPDHIEYSDIHEAPASDFLKQPLIPDEGDAKQVGYALVAGKLWRVLLARKWALFPLKTGELDIGSMALSIARPRVAGDPRRLSESIKVKVTEPPAADRPPGYVVGDVGNFSLAAEVTPREVERGGAVAVNVTLSGTGNLPAKLAVPSRAGVEWLDPQVRDAIGAENDKVGGKRTFAYVVRMQQEGEIDLGELRVAFWDPDAKKYGTSKVSLGKVLVKPGARPAMSADPAQEVLAGLPAARAERSAPRPARAHLADSRVFWLGLGASPLAFAVVFGAHAAASRLRKRREENEASPARERKARVAAAESACRADDARAADAAIARAIEAAAIAGANVNVRGVRGDEVASKLEDAGVAAEAARTLEAVLRECEAARFAPDAAGIDAARARWDRAKGALAALEVK